MVVGLLTFMRKCFEFSAHADGNIEGKLHKLPDGKAMFDLCGEMRNAGKKGFLVRAENVKEAEKRYASLPQKYKNIETVFIL